MKLTIRHLAFFALVFIWQFPAHASGRLTATMSILVNKNRYTFECFRKSHQDLLIEKARLLHVVSASGTPSLNIVNQKGTTGARLVPAVSGEVDFRELSLWLDINPLYSATNTSGGIMLPLYSTRRQRVRLLDSMIAIEKMKSYFQIESTILQDIKGICDLVVSVNQARDELTIRSEVGREIDRLVRFIENFSRSGQINKRSFSQLKLVLMENSLHIENLQKRIELLDAELQNRFFIEQGQLDRVKEECRTVVLNDKCSGFAVGASGGTFTIAECIDSLNKQMQATRRSYATMTDFAVKAGPRIEVPKDWSSASLGTGIRCSFSFFSRKPPLVHYSIPAPMSGPLYFQDTVTGPDSIAFNKVHSYVEQTRQEISNIIEELKSGMYYSIPWLNDLFSRIIYSQTNIMQLHYSYLRYRISIIHSLEALGLRSDLMALYFEGK